MSHGLQSEQSINPLEIKFDGNEIYKSDIVSIIGGGGHTLVLDKLGNVYGCGWNNHGQLTGSIDKNVMLTKITALQNHYIIQITCGWDASYVLTQEGLVLVWGSNKHGQLGIPKKKVSKLFSNVRFNFVLYYF